MKIKELNNNGSMGEVKFKHPETGKTCVWVSQWGYEDGKAGVWYKDLECEDKNRIFPLCLDSLEEALEFEIVE